MTVPQGAPAAGAGPGMKSDERRSYGWVVVAAGIVMLAGFLGAQLSFGVFLRPLADQFGWSRAAVSGAMSLSMGFSGLIGVLMGRFTDKYSMSAVVALGMVAGAVSYFLLSKIGSLWQLYLCFGLGGGICSGCAYTPVSATVSKWFVRKRALALGVAFTGIVVGQIVLSPALSHVIATQGWRTAYLVLALLVVVCGVPAIFLMARKPAAQEQSTADPGTVRGGQGHGLLQGYSVAEAVRTPPFWMLMVTGLTIAAGFYTVIAHIVPYARDMKVSVGPAALILTMSGVGSLAGTLLASPLMERLSGRRTLLLLIVGQAAAMFLFIIAASTWSFYVVALLFGFSLGAASPVRMAMVPPLFGLRAVGAILGWCTFFWSVGGIVGPYLAGAVYDATGSYDIAFLTGGLLLLVGAATVLLWGAHKQKRTE